MRPIPNRMRLAAVATLLFVAAPSRAQLADGLAKYLGNVYSTSQVTDFTSYWNQVTPENAGKWGSAEPNRDQFNWGQLDAAYALAKDNGYIYHHHVLIWGSQQPGWIEVLSPSEQLEEIEEWFAALAERYPDMDIVEVVNEPLHQPPDAAHAGKYIDALGGAAGRAWIMNAFRMARTHFPGSRLMINDYGIVNNTNNAQNLLAIVQQLQTENLVDIIGVQAHAFSTRYASADAIKANLDLLATSGLPIHVTELDIDSQKPDGSLSQAVQYQEYQRVFPVLWEHPAVEGVTLWGWRRGLWRDEQGAYLVELDGSERFALTWLRGYVPVLLDADDPAAALPADFRLLGNYPNPFNPRTTIAYDLARPGMVRLEVFDLAGRSVTTLVDGFQPAAEHRVEWDAVDALGRPVPSGVYLYRLTLSGDVATTATRPMVVIK